jgi:hypothetical protein
MFFCPRGHGPQSSYVCLSSRDDSYEPTHCGFGGEVSCWLFAWAGLKPWSSRPLPLKLLRLQMWVTVPALGKGFLTWVLIQEKRFTANAAISEPGEVLTFYLEFIQYHPVDKSNKLKNMSVENLCPCCSVPWNPLIHSSDLNLQIFPDPYRFHFFVKFHQITPASARFLSLNACFLSYLYPLNKLGQLRGDW